GDSRTGRVLYEIIKSKDKLYAKGKNFHTHLKSTFDGGSTGPGYGRPVTQDKEVESSSFHGRSSEANQPHHDYKKQKTGPPFEPNYLPITFVPQVSAQSPGKGQSCVKKRRKNKKRANKKLGPGDE